jgi:hypothetical protein
MRGIRRFLFIVFVSLSFQAAAQEAIKSRPSPTSIVAARYKDTYLKITYSQPHKRGRMIFGSLVPYGQVWRTGANEATEMTITKDILINNSPLRAGTYSIFTIPDKGKLDYHYQQRTGPVGLYNYNAKLDVMRFTFHPKHFREPSMNRSLY